MWVPLDVILTVLIVFYQMFYRYMEKLEEAAIEEEEQTVVSDDYINQNGKQSLGPIELFSINNNEDDGEIKLNMDLF